MSFEAIAWAFRQELPTVRKFVLVALADYADEAGSCFPSIGKTAKRTGASESTVRRAIRDLEAGGYLRVEAAVRPNGSATSNRYHLNLARQGAPVTVTPPPCQSDGGAPVTSDTPITTSSNHHRTKNVDDVDTLPLELEDKPAPKAKDKPTTGRRYTPEFEQWWTKYPSNAGKYAAGKAWDKLVREGMTAEELTSLLEDYLLARQAAEARGARVPFLPNASTWLNQGRWEDVADLRPQGAATAPDSPAGLELAPADIDRILGPDYWTPPAPPAELDLLAARDWTRARTAEHRAARHTAALAALTARTPR